MQYTQGQWVVSPHWSYKKGISAKDTTQNEPDGYSVDARVERKTLGGQESPYSIAIANMQTYSNGKRPMDEVQANANLIASAPEMLKALKKCVNFYFEGISDFQDEVYALIAKAEGE